MHLYRYLPYDANSPALFKKEEIRLRELLGQEPIIEHFGSSSIVGLGGKGFIDIYIVVPKEKMLVVSQQLQNALGYEYKPEGGVEGERLYHKLILKVDGKERIYHVHLTYIGSKDYTECIVFRDYLRTHPEYVKKYADIKKFAAEQVSKESDRVVARTKYMAIKRVVIDEVLKKAMA